MADVTSASLSPVRLVGYQRKALSYSLGRRRNYCNHFAGQFGNSSQKVKHTIWPSVSFGGCPEAVLASYIWGTPPLYEEVTEHPLFFTKNSLVVNKMAGRLGS